ncbi:MAG: hypothetical protein HYZ26_11230 [Chloroflexi bacterium]|nr:hypothetical protein [Chloroflexota bacterium]
MTPVVESAVLERIESPRDALLAAAAYADVFDAPLSDLDAHRYAIKVPVSLAAAREELRALVAAGRLTHSAGWYCLPGREKVVERRREGQPRARRAWSFAERYARWVAQLPHVRMVGLTGALANEDSGPDGDVDFLVVTEPDRLWSARAAILLLGRALRITGPTLCPNYLMSARALALEDRNLFAAQELARMVPLAGGEIYGRLRRENAWAADFLPNAGGSPRPDALMQLERSWLQGSAEAFLRSRAGDSLERWEMQRKIRRLRAQANGSHEAVFGPDQCKGHFAGHARRTLEKFEARLEQVL